VPSPVPATRPLAGAALISSNDAWHRFPHLKTDLSELNLGKSTSIVFPDGKDKLLRFNITLRPEEGLYRGGAFTFTFVVPPVYPHEPPKVKCTTKVYHPNIDLDGNVCLNILREDWKPVLSISSCIFGLHHLFLDPNHDDPLNKEAAEVLRDNPRQFEANVRRSVAGGLVGAWHNRGAMPTNGSDNIPSRHHPTSSTGSTHFPPARE
jgi:ubiquitin-conjugating enzyme E2 M